MGFVEKYTERNRLGSRLQLTVLSALIYINAPRDLNLLFGLLSGIKHCVCCSYLEKFSIGSSRDYKRFITVECNCSDRDLGESGAKSTRWAENGFGKRNKPYNFMSPYSTKYPTMQVT